MLVGVAIAVLVFIGREDGVRRGNVGNLLQISLDVAVPQPQDEEQVKGVVANWDESPSKNLKTPESKKVVAPPVQETVASGKHADDLVGVKADRVAAKEASQREAAQEMAVAKQVGAHVSGSMMSSIHSNFCNSTPPFPRGEISARLEMRCFVSRFVSINLVCSFAGFVMKHVRGRSRGSPLN